MRSAAPKKQTSSKLSNTSLSATKNPQPKMTSQKVSHTSIGFQPQHGVDLHCRIYAWLYLACGWYVKNIQYMLIISRILMGTAEGCGHNYVVWINQVSMVRYILPCVLGRKYDLHMVFSFCLTYFEGESCIFICVLWWSYISCYEPWLFYFKMKTPSVLANYDVIQLWTRRLSTYVSSARLNLEYSCDSEKNPQKRFQVKSLTPLKRGRGDLQGTYRDVLP